MLNMSKLSYYGIDFSYNYSGYPWFDAQQVLQILKNILCEYNNYSDDVYDDIYNKFNGSLQINYYYLYNYICRRCNVSFDNIIMSTINYNIKYHMSLEDILNLGIKSNTILNSDIYNIIINYVHNLEYENEKDDILNIINFNYVKRMHPYIHSLISLYDLIDIFKNMYRLHFNGYTYKITIHSASYNRYIYVENGFNTRLIAINDIKTRYYDYDYVKTVNSFNNEFLNFSRLYIIPVLYYKSEISIFTFNNDSRLDIEVF